MSVMTATPTGLLHFDNIGFTAVNAEFTNEFEVTLFDVYLTKRLSGFIVNTYFDEVTWDLKTGLMTFYQSWGHGSDKEVLWDAMFTVNVTVIEE